jgi:hypothetical protein
MKVTLIKLLSAVTIITAIILIVISVASCAPADYPSSDNAASSVNNSYVTFTRVYSNYSFYVYVENVTDVMYLAFLPASGGGVTVMLDTDGTPLLYSEWKERAQTYE